jgi:uncharacterized metal-binding protein (TIGR02443 family)
MAYSEKRRFIAGAVCPKCSTMDTLVVYRLEERDYRECVSCGFREEMHFKPQVRELDTRVNTSADEKREQVQVVKILPDAKH